MPATSPKKQNKAVKGSSATQKGEYHKDGAHFSLADKDQFDSIKDQNHDGRVSKSEGKAGKIGDLNNDGRVTRSEARAMMKVKALKDSLKFESLP